MLISFPLDTEYRGVPGQVTAVRNDGYLWGVLELTDGRRFELVPDEDWYDLPDCAVLDRFDEFLRYGGDYPIELDQIQ